MPLRSVSLCLLLILSATSSPAQSQKVKGPYTIDRETTRITEPVRDDGTIDYVAALSRRHREGVTPENNSVVSFRRAFGHRDLDEETAAEYFEELGMEVPPKEGDYLVTVADFARSLDQSDLPMGSPPDANISQVVFEQQGEVCSRPWTRDEFPLMVRWLDVNERPLTFAVEGSTRPKYFVPVLPKEGPVVAILLADVQALRGVARLLSARAMLKLGEGDVDAAWNDVLAGHRIARLVTQGPTLVEYLVGVAIESILCKCDEQVSDDEQLSVTQARRFLADLDRLDDLPGVVDRIDEGERFVFLDSVGAVATNGADAFDALVGFTGSGDDDVPGTVVKNAILKRLVDWDVVLRTGNATFDRLVKAGRLPTRMARLRESDRIKADLALAAKRAKAFNLTTLLGGGPSVSDRVATIMVALFVPAVPPIFEAEDRCRMQTALSRCAFALAAWKADHGSYPDRLERLSPQYIRQIPGDIHTGRSLVYRPSRSGYALYGLGQNLKDDGGLTFGEGEGTDDLVVRASE